MSDQKPCCAARRPSGAERAEINFIPATDTALDDMMKISAGEFLMGTDDNDGFAADGEGPVRQVFVADYLIGTTTVTNQMFARFVAATGYQTDAERYGWSFVFDKLLPAEAQLENFEVVAETPWWCAVPGACWAKPEGEMSAIADRMDHPVVHVSWNDAMAYCHWIGQRLPAEAEWEKAVRGGLVQNKYPWGNELTPVGKHQCNIWQGDFPLVNTVEDGYLGTAPANAYEPNGCGLYNCSGNVWEWCADWFDADALNGPTARVIKGGSFLCHHSYCNRYRVAARSANTPDSSASNTGFRCAAGA